MEIYSEEVRYKKEFLEIIFFPGLIVIACVPLFSDKGFTEIIIGIVGSLLAIIFFLPWLNKLIGFKRITITSEFLLIESFLLKKYKTVRYELNKIHKPISKSNEKAESYRSYGHVTILGMRHHPESLREYDLNPMTVHFEYGKSHIKIGEGLESFNGKKIVEIIKKQRKITKNNKR